MKKRVLFATASLGCGGVEKSLLAILAFLPRDKFDVTLMLTKKVGALLPYVPECVKVTETPFTKQDRYELEHGRVAALKQAVLHFYWFRALRMLILRAMWRLSGAKESYNEIVVKDMVSRIEKDSMRVDFDYAFAYGGGVNVGVVIRDLIKAPVKAIWCHGENEIGLVKDRLWRTLHATFTHRFATGQMCDRLNHGLERDQKPFEVMPYSLDERLAHRMAMEEKGFQDVFDGIRILTVGRLSHQKGIDDAVRIAARLKEENLRFRWYIVGDGEEREALERQVVASNVGDCFILLGQHINPYPFFKACDIYAQPSRFEVYCITVAEARMFCKPIICTDFVGAREQLRDGDTGTITPLADVEAFHQGLRLLIEDEDMRKRYAKALSQESADSTHGAEVVWRKLLDF